MSPLNPSPPLFSTAPITGVADFDRPWNSVDLLEIPQKRAGRYLAGYAHSDRMVREAQRLRYEVFNLELGEGLASSVATGLDADDFDRQMHHLVLVQRTSGNVVGTYRMQTGRAAQAGIGFYSADAFDLSPLTTYNDRMIELGRACLAKDCRSYAAIINLWQGIAHYLDTNDAYYMIGCCSLTSTDPDDGWRALKLLRAKNCLHPDLWVKATPKYTCGAPGRECDPDLGTLDKLPKLFNAYMRLGSTIISEPAVDYEFGTVDFLGFMDRRNVTMAQFEKIG